MSIPNADATVLVVEDDNIAYFNITRGFKRMGLKNVIVRAVDGKEALEILESREISHPYTILLDLQMPRMNGLEFLEAVRKDDRFADSNIFVLTSSADEKDIERCFRHNVAGYFTKSDMNASTSEMAHFLSTYWRKSHLPQSNPSFSV